MSDFLSVMARASRERVQRAQLRVPLDDICDLALQRQVVPTAPLSSASFDIIAEIKRRAPSAGTLQHAGDEAIDFVTEQRNAYTRGGAAAISVLTEPNQFSGDLRDIETASEGTSIPIMRKDFLVDPYQVYEARLHGASGILLIARMIEPPEIEAFVTAAEATGQFVLLEIFDREELTTVELFLRAVGGRNVSLLIGVNARDLATLDVDTDRFPSLRPDLPDEVPTVAESGLLNEHDIASVASLGYRAALVGTALMRSGDPALTVARFLEVGRRAA